MTISKEKLCATYSLTTNWLCVCAWWLEKRFWMKFVDVKLRIWGCDKNGCVCSFSVQSPSKGSIRRAAAGGTALLCTCLYFTAHLHWRLEIQKSRNLEIQSCCPVAVKSRSAEYESVQKEHSKALPNYAQCALPQWFCSRYLRVFRFQILQKHDWSHCGGF